MPNTQHPTFGPLFITLLTACLLLLLSSNLVHAKAAPDSFAPLVEKLMPAVVNISTSQKIKTSNRRGGVPFQFQLPDDPQLDPFREFFEQFNKGMPHGGSGGGSGAQEEEVFSLGSAFIISADGYVVTNNHVIDEAEEIQVILQDDTKLDAKIIGRDPKTDLALLKVESKTPLPFVRFGDSDASKVGDWIIAIGNPFGLGGSVSAGIISARSRSINAGPFDDFIQTDAAINRGNSGGPMFNMKGEVVGINTAIFSPSGGNVGIGFAVPSSQAAPVINQLKEHGRTFRGWLGVKIQHVDDKIAESVGLKEASGALVIEITKNSPATKSDIEPGDIILEFDGKKVDEMRKLPRIVAETKVGKKVDVTLWRDGKTRRTTVTLGELDEGTSETSAKDDKADNPQTTKDVQTTHMLGMDLAVVDSKLRTRFQLAKDTNGVIVLKVKNGSAAAKQKLRVGDIITRVNDRTIGSIATLQSSLKSLKKSGRDYALVRILRGEQNLFVTLPTGEQ